MTGAPATAGDLPLEPVVTVAAGATAMEVARVMAETGSSIVLVVDDPVRVVTQLHVVDAVASGRLDEAVDSRACEPCCVPPEAEISAVVFTMLRYGVPGVVVVDDLGRPLGVLTLAVATACLLESPSWLGALRLALRVEQSSRWERR